MTLDGGQVVLLAGMLATGLGQWFAFRSKMADVKLQIERLHACVHDGNVIQTAMQVQQAAMHAHNETVQQATLVKVEEIADKISDGKRD